MIPIKVIDYVGTTNELILVFEGEVDGKKQKFEWPVSQMLVLSGKGLTGKMDIKWDATKIQ